MPTIDDAWQGSVQFWELVFGTWLVYIFLVLMWERVLRERLPEWKYVMITFLGASFYWINHYFQHAPFYFWLLNAYTAVVWVAYYMIAVRGRGSLVWTDHGRALDDPVHGGIHPVRAIGPVPDAEPRRAGVLVHARQLFRLHRRDSLAPLRNGPPTRTRPITPDWEQLPAHLAAVTSAPCGGTPKPSEYRGATLGVPP